MLNADTIAAIATAQGRGGVGVVRISGKNAPDIARAILGTLPEARRASYLPFVDVDGSILDQGIGIYFPAPHSYTGEHVIELQGHGGPAILQLLLQRCLDLGCRLAQPGEFTQRAYLNNKLDLAQAESVADLINANTTQAARSAIRSLQGEFSREIQALVDQLIYLRMLVEAMLDFPEEEIDDTNIQQRDNLLNQILSQLATVLNRAKQGSLLREGAHIVIAGQPNAGKSSLLNALSGEEVALVSDVPGTTRDVIKQMIQISGVPLHILDTAGLRQSEDVVENMGIQRTHQTIAQADLIVLLIDASKGYTEQDQQILDQLPHGIPCLFVLNKIDLATAAIPDTLREKNIVSVSAKHGKGLDTLRETLLQKVGWQDLESGIFMARERHLRALNLAQFHLHEALLVIRSAEVFAEELRQAQHALCEITGEFTPDDLLGEIFSRFCIGK